MSDHRGQDQDPAERLASALRRIAVGIERREAVAAATQAALEAISRDGAAGDGAARDGAAPGVEGPLPAASLPIASLPGVAADLDALIRRLRVVLDGIPAAANPDRGN